MIDTSEARTEASQVRMRAREFWEDTEIVEGNERVVEYVSLVKPGQPNHVLQMRVSYIKPRIGAHGKQMGRPDLWAAIEPQYRAWKEARDIPEGGTAVDTWAGATRGQVQLLQSNGVRTVEELAELDDGALARIGPGAMQLRHKAQHFLAKAREAEKVKAANSELEQQIAALQAQLAALQSQPSARAR